MAAPAAPAAYQTLSLNSVTSVESTTLARTWTTSVENSVHQVDPYAAMLWMIQDSNRAPFERDQAFWTDPNMQRRKDTTL